MPDEGRNPLELDAVVRRFAESTEALSKIRVQLQALTELREAEQRTNASLQETAGQVSQFAAVAAEILKGLEEAQTTVVDVLKVGSDLLDGTELKGIAESVNVNSEAISGVDGRVDGLESKVAELIGIVGTLQATIEQGMETLKGKMESVHADVKTPVVKRLFR